MIRTLRRRAPALLAVMFSAALAGCGFKPLYGEGSGGDAQTLAQVRVDNIPDRSGQMLRNLLLDRMTPKGEPQRPAYALEVRLQEQRQDLAVRQDEKATRANLIITANFTLTPLDPGDRRRFTAQAYSTNSFNRLQSDYATLTAEEDARARGLRTLAEEIRLRVAAALEHPQQFMALQPATPPAPRRDYGPFLPPPAERVQPPR